MGPRVFPWTPTAGDGFFVRAVESERALVLGGDAVPVGWALVLEPIDETNTRLVTHGRERLSASPSACCSDSSGARSTSSCNDGNCSTSGRRVEAAERS
jgi:hypothetical protein